jgi:hypothetical protein
MKKEEQQKRAVFLFKSYYKSSRTDMVAEFRKPLVGFYVSGQPLSHSLTSAVSLWHGHSCSGQEVVGKALHGSPGLRIGLGLADCTLSPFQF